MNRIWSVVLVILTRLGMVFSAVGALTASWLWWVLTLFCTFCMYKAVRVMVNAFDPTNGSKKKAE